MNSFIGVFHGKIEILELLVCIPPIIVVAGNVWIQFNYLTELLGRVGKSSKFYQRVAKCVVSDFKSNSIFGSGKNIRAVYELFLRIRPVSTEVKFGIIIGDGKGLCKTPQEPMERLPTRTPSPHRLRPKVLTSRPPDLKMTRHTPVEAYIGERSP